MSLFVFFLDRNVEILEFNGNWPIDVKEKFLKDFKVIENFINEEEESSLLQEIEPYLKRMRYERDHWDDAIQGKKHPFI